MSLPNAHIDTIQTAIYMTLHARTVDADKLAGEITEMVEHITDGSETCDIDSITTMLRYMSESDRVTLDVIVSDGEVVSLGYELTAYGTALAEINAAQFYGKSLH